MFMLEYGVDITLSSNIVDMEEISNIQCYFSTKKTSLHKKIQQLFPKFMLAPL